LEKCNISYLLPTGPSKVFDCLGKSHIKGVVDECMADRYLFDARKVPETVEIDDVEIVNVTWLDVALVFAGVNSDTLTSGLNAGASGLYDIWLMASPGIA